MNASSNRFLMCSFRQIFRLGIMLHVLLTGRLPFLGSGRRLQDIISRGRIVVNIRIYKQIYKFP